ncbi:hypothetical protein Tco_0343095 [Tanacetum coccineum]
MYGYSIGASHYQHQEEEEPFRYLEEIEAQTIGNLLPDDDDLLFGVTNGLDSKILLRGVNGDELKKVKHVVQYGVFAAYHLALETSFLADEGASLLELPLNAATLTVGLLDKPSNIERSISRIPGFTALTNEKPPQACLETHNVSPRHTICIARMGHRSDTCVVLVALMNQQDSVTSQREEIKLITLDLSGKWKARICDYNIEFGID